MMIYLSLSHFMRSLLFVLCLALTSGIVKSGRANGSASSAEPPRPVSGEIRFDGEIRAVATSGKSLTILVQSYTLPNGRTSRLASPKLKTVLVDEKTTILLGADTPRVIAWEEVFEWMPVVVIGKDTGSGKAVPARVLRVQEAPLYIDPPLDETKAKSSELMSAALFGFNDDVTRLLDAGANVNEQDESGKTPLTVAGAMNQSDTVKLLLARGADPNLPGKDGHTALTFVAPFGHQEIARILLAHGADANAVTRKGLTALMLAVGMNKIEMARALLENGADPNKKTRIGATPLHSAAAAGHLEIVRLLLDNAANPDTKDQSGRTTLDVARAAGHDEILQLLQKISSKAASPEK